ARQRRPISATQPRRRGRLPVALLEPGIGGVVVAVPLPEAEVVLSRHLDRLEPLRALPEVLAGDQGSQREAVLWGQLLAVVTPYHSGVVLAGDIERDAGAEPAGAVEDDERRLGPQPSPIEEVTETNPREAVVEAAPRGDAVDVAEDVDAGEGVQLSEAQRDLTLDGAGDTEAPPL